MAEKPKLSLLTFCKSRLADVKKFLPGCVDAMYPDDEIVFVDYDCPDKSGEYVTSQYRKRVTVVTVKNAPWWEMNRARNVAARAASGEVFIFNDIDQAVTRDAVDEIRRMRRGTYMLQPNRVGACGFVAMWANDFYCLNGYEESFVGYGVDDTHTYESLRRMGRAAVQMESEINRQHDAEQVRCIVPLGIRAHCMVNHKISTVLRQLHPWKHNVGRNWGVGGEVVQWMVPTHG